MDKLALKTGNPRSARKRRKRASHIPFARLCRLHWLRLVRSSSSPKAMARGIGIGVAVGVSPWIGLHIWMAAGLAWLVRGNILAAVLGSLIGNYVTFLPIMLVDHKLGVWLLSALQVSVGNTPHTPHLHDMIANPLGFFHSLFAQPMQALPLFLPILAGSLLLGMVLYLLCSLFLPRFFMQMKHKRRARLQVRAKKSNMPPL